MSKKHPSLRPISFLLLVSLFISPLHSFTFQRVPLPVSNPSPKTATATRGIYHPQGNQHYYLLNHRRTSSSAGITTINNMVKGNPKTRQESQEGKLSVNQILFVSYGVLSNFVLTRVFSDPKMYDAISTTLWLGFVLAISGMEAWLKFQAPFCPRAFALDIGRTIFPALNSVEAGLGLSLWSRMYNSGRPTLLPLVVATIILILQIGVLTPRLVLRGKQTVYEHVKEHGSTKAGTYSPQFALLAAELDGKPLPRRKDVTHFIYVGLEVVKMGSLFALLMAIGR